MIPINERIVWLLGTFGFDGSFGLSCQEPSACEFFWGFLACLSLFATLVGDLECTSRVVFEVGTLKFELQLNSYTLNSCNVCASFFFFF